MTQSQQDILAPLLSTAEDTEQTQKNLDKRRAQVSGLLALWGDLAHVCIVSVLLCEAKQQMTNHELTLLDSSPMLHQLHLGPSTPLPGCPENWTLMCLLTVLPGILQIAQ